MVKFENGTLEKEAYVIIDGKEYVITPAEYKGATPLSAEMLNKMQEEILKADNPVRTHKIGN